MTTQIIKVPPAILKALLDIPSEATIVGVTMHFDQPDEIVFKVSYPDEQTGELPDA